MIQRQGYYHKCLHEKSHPLITSLDSCRDRHLQLRHQIIVTKGGICEQELKFCWARGWTLPLPPVILPARKVESQGTVPSISSAPNPPPGPSPSLSSTAPIPPPSGTKGSLSGVDGDYQNKRTRNKKRRMLSGGSLGNPIEEQECERMQERRAAGW